MQDVTTSIKLTKKKPQKQDRLTTYLRGEPCDIIDSLFLEYLKTRSLEKLRVAVGVMEEIFLETRKVEDNLLMQGGIGKRYTKACLATKYAKSVLSALEDVLCDVLVDGTDLQQKYIANKFLFQQIWE